MNFSIVTVTVADTTGESIYALGHELMDVLESEMNHKYENVDLSIGIALRCVPERCERKSFTRYTKKDNYLTIDITVFSEVYEKMYKVEQRYNLGNIFMEYLNKALDKHKFNGLDKEEFIADIKSFSKSFSIKMDNGKIKLNNWFNDEIDWSVDLDK